MGDEENSVFLSEVAAQPAALRALIQAYRGDDGQVLRAWASRARAAGRVIFSGMGTSEFAAEMILVHLARHGVEAVTRDAGEWLHYPRPTDGLPVLISQSGESIETRQLAERVSQTTSTPGAPSPFIAVTNTPESTLARLASLTLLMHAGPEAAISTKTYTNTLAVLYLMAKAVEGEAALAEGLAQLEQLAGVMADVDREGIAQATALLAPAPALQIISRGPAMAAAKQTALTFMEGTQTPTCALTGGAFRHGPFELVGQRHFALFLIPDGPTGALLTAMAEEIAEQGSTVVVITNREVSLPPETCRVLRVLPCAEMLFPLAAAVTQEFLLYHLAAARGLIAGHFRYGQKVTDRE